MSYTLPRAIARWWNVANERRLRLIRKKHRGSGLTEAQKKELELLQAVADAMCSYSAPMLPKGIDEATERLG